MTTGKLITLEGGEGAGKSTQADMLARRLREEHDLEVVVTREPGGAPFAERIRELILSEQPAAPVTEFLLFAAARSEHIAVTIAPAIAAGKWVICDRFIDSTRVYQGRLWGISPTLIDAIERFTVAPHMPDLTIVFDVSAEMSVARAATRGEMSRYDAAQIDQHRLVRDGFLDVVADEPERCVGVDGSRDVEAVAGSVFDVVHGRLLAKVRS